MPSILKRRSARIGALGLAASAILGLSACSSDYVAFDALGPSVEPEKPAPLVVAAPAVTRPVSRVDSLEIGTMRNGVAVTAYGEAPTARWFGARLEPRRGGQTAPDGFLEFDLVAAPPELNGGAPAPAGTPAQRRIRADLALSREEIAGAVGVRVFAGSGAVAARF